MQQQKNQNLKEKRNKKKKRKSTIKEEEINKYDSDEESQKNESNSESENEKEIENEIKKNSSKKLKNNFSDSSETIGNFINSLSKEKTCLYEINNLNFYDEDLIKKINFDNINNEEENLNNILLELNQEMCFDDVDKVFFYSDFFTSSKHIS